MITVYSADWCGFCHMTKRYFHQQDIEFTEKNVESDPQAAIDAVEKSGQRGIPVIDIDGEIIVGFDRPAIDAALRSKKR